MKRKIIIIIIFFIILSLLFIKLAPFGTSTYKDTYTTLEIPSLSFIDNIQKNSISKTTIYEYTFKTLKNKHATNIIMKNILNKYEKDICNNKIVYYNKKYNNTITEVNISDKGLFNILYIKVINKKNNINECSKITDPTKLKYEIRKSSLNYNGIRYTSDKFKYLNNDGNIYDVYYQHPDDILFYTGTGVAKYFEHLLQFGWMSMQDLIDYFEDQAKNKKASKIINKEIGYIIYKNKDFSILECNTSDGNKNIYIGDRNLTYQNNYCK